MKSMKLRNLILPLIAAMILILFLPLTLRAHTAPPAAPGKSLSVDPKTPGTPAPVEKDDKAKNRNFPNYKKYLDSSEELGFSPNPRLFGAIHSLLNTQFYGKVTEEKLTDGAKQEVERLFKEAQAEAPPFKDKSFSSPEDFLNAAVAQANSKVSKDLILYSALCGLLKGTDDPYTVYLTPKEYGQLMEQMQSASFGGIGTYIEVDKDNDNWLTVIEPMEGTPAWNAGIKTGDVISEIDGKSTKGLSIDLAVTRLRGPKGTPVTLTIMRKGTKGTLKFTLLREKIQVKSVTYKILNNTYGYVKLRNFGEETSHELEAALREMEGKGIKGVVMDLRNNGGGYINAAVSISGIFLGKGESIVTVKDKMGNSKSHNSKGDYKLSLPLAVLVNKYSASASEITAGAIKDYKRGALVGTKTFGKGSVQQVMPFPDGSALKVTVSHYYTPNGSDIDKNGLEPDYKVEMEPKDVGKDKDPQLDTALQILKGITPEKGSTTTQIEEERKSPR
ncbi:MAG: S41 family peptidase [Candidatus Eremiobacteraeota bacterium]|nr:S41 family peptidase [Candidatus Eremiobacteraeota bacterium]